MYPVASEYDAPFVTTLALLKLATLLDTQVEQSAEVGVDSGSFEFVLCFALSLPVVAYCRLVPCASALVTVSEFLPLSVDGGLCLRH